MCLRRASHWPPFQRRVTHCGSSAALWTRPLCCPAVFPGPAGSPAGFLLAVHSPRRPHSLPLTGPLEAQKAAPWTRSPPSRPARPLPCCEAEASAGRQQARVGECPGFIRFVWLSHSRRRAASIPATWVSAVCSAGHLAAPSPSRIISLILSTAAAPGTSRAGTPALRDLLAALLAFLQPLRGKPEPSGRGEPSLAPAGGEKAAGPPRLCGQRPAGGSQLPP